ncbi:MAG TPA: NAD(P)-binding domain-containing protein [Flavisolibacter sp.]|nr:NAD(P)-binding domain-containing protein [Flavisolibacter sp.]
MHTPQTIVIIGLGDTCKGIANGLSNGNDRVLLCDEKYETAKSLANGLQEAYPYFDVEAINCSYEAVWEGDVIILALPCTLHQEVAEKIRAVANQKVVVTTHASLDALQQLLPNSKLVQAFDKVDPGAFYLPPSQRHSVDCTVTGNDQEAVKAVSSLVKTIGFNPVAHSNIEMA